MQYPDEFDVPAFPAGKRIAISRAMGVAVMTVFLLIICACGFLLWAQRSARVHPFLVSVNNITGQWDVVGHHHHETPEMPAMRMLQESLLGKYVQYWFQIKDDEIVNAAVWQSCDRKTECNPERKTGIDTNACAIYCMSGEDAYNKFISAVVPDYQVRFARGEMWQIDLPSLQTIPVNQWSENGGYWQIKVVLYSNKNPQPMNVLAYARIGRNMDAYPKTMGYYIAEFNAYRIN